MNLCAVDGVGAGPVVQVGRIRVDVRLRVVLLAVHDAVRAVGFEDVVLDADLDAGGSGVPPMHVDGEPVRRVRRFIANTVVDSILSPSDSDEVLVEKNRFLRSLLSAEIRSRRMVGKASVGDPSGCLGVACR
jgi:hypothetical protein